MNAFMSKKTNGILWSIGYAVVSDDRITLKKHGLSDNKVKMALNELLAMLTKDNKAEMSRIKWHIVY